VVANLIVGAFDNVDFVFLCADELFVEITRLPTHDNTAESLGNNAQQYLQSKQGATDKLMQKITSLCSLISSKCQRWFLLASMSSIKE
jgi:hypothetical protein